MELFIPGTMIVRYPLGFILAAGLIAGCGEPRQSSSPPPPPVAQAAPDSIPLVVFVGTSLTAGYGLSDPRLA